MDFHVTLFFCNKISCKDTRMTALLLDQICSFLLKSKHSQSVTFKSFIGGCFVGWVKP